MPDQLSLSLLRSRRDQIRNELDALKAELGELDIAERVLLRLSIRENSSPQPIGTMEANAVPLPIVKVDEVQRSKGTLEELIRTFLLEGHKTGWATANEVKDWLVWRMGRDVPMSSVSPTLSNMKGKGLIVRDGLKVAATERASIDGDFALRENGQTALILSTQELSLSYPPDEVDEVAPSVEATQAVE